MCDEPVRTRVLARGSWTGAAGVPDPRARRGPGRRRRVRRHRRGAADAPRCSRRSRGARAIVIGPSNPVISIGPILAVPGMREALARGAGAGRRGLPDRRRRGAQGPDRGVHGARRAAGRRGRHRARLRRRARRAARRRGARASTACRVQLADTLMADADGTAPRRRARGARRFARRAHPAGIDLKGASHERRRRPAGQALRDRQAPPRRRRAALVRPRRARHRDARPTSSRR